MNVTRKYHPEGSPVTKEHTWYTHTDKWALAQRSEYPRYNSKTTGRSKKKEEQSVDTLVLLKREQISHVRR